MKKLLFVLCLLTLISSASALSITNVTYPVSDLGNCENQTACEIYCNDNQNIENCLNFAEKNGLMSEEEIAQARKILPYLIAGTTPGNCKSEKDCNEYCDKEENLEECINFALEIGEISTEEAEMVKKTGGKGPGGCKRDECKTYCDDESHFSECIEFAIANGLMSAEEAEMAKKTGGKGPGNCKGQEECDAYCQSEENIEECIDFSIQYGLMDPKDAEMMRKTKGKGPGGCKGQEECDAFCKNPDNQETCLNFAIEYGLLSEEELANMKKNQEFTNSEEGQCFMQCMKDAGVDSKNCAEDGTGPEACQTCGEKCFTHDETSGGNCLSQEKWQQLDTDCKAKGSGYHLEEVKGSNGQGRECIVDETCVYSSGEEWESQEEKDRKLAEMEEQWAKEREEYESSQSGGNQGTDSYSGGCTEPGPEGQCGSGDGGGSSDGSGGDSSSGGSSEGSSGSEGESSGDSGAGITGAVIMRYDSENIFKKILNSFKK